MVMSPSVSFVCISADNLLLDVRIAPSQYYFRVASFRIFTQDGRHLFWLYSINIRRSNAVIEYPMQLMFNFVDRLSRYVTLSIYSLELAIHGHITS